MFFSKKRKRLLSIIYYIEQNYNNRYPAMKLDDIKIETILFIAEWRYLVEFGESFIGYSWSKGDLGIGGSYVYSIDFFYTLIQTSKKNKDISYLEDDDKIILDNLLLEINICNYWSYSWILNNLYPIKNSKEGYIDLKKIYKKYKEENKKKFNNPISKLKMYSNLLD